mmetsp:Transcript_87926/g.192877  ORF Transcript_87926/g.192877 Transcript_87926/m.192877 type:complete len:742 (-) Transcript_87926:50-2275(-)|eukprot:CAMPEP_0206433434 /NCGR_PEP_ID=MMETSP0324_2-20121206/8528_1 /ASSEMBLY_ACC=CAM_ASM_000836 /TAXON_ID=2866 /ORGANISM="Crypthecodinium cohnii, Strain Seligo" /LENGTH=741 /DNA_ID=CAMNT_0053899693 /DNA_START=170 /DNA_END=2395 /DNA_ORIENTATION=+
MGKKKGAVLAKARAKREANFLASSATAGGDGGPEGGGSATAPAGPIVQSDGCRVHRGLQNLGNTCYMNSIVQCLNVSTTFSDELLKAAPPQKKGLAASLGTVFRGVRNLEATANPTSAHNPKPFQQAVTSSFPWFKGGGQHDSHEFLRTLLGGISDEYEEFGRSSGSDAQPSDLVSSCFGGRYCAATLCWTCRSISLRLDPFLDLQLHLPALAGQARGNLGLSVTQRTGEPEALPPTEGAADADNSDDSDGPRRGKKKGGKKAREAARAKAEVQPKAAPTRKLGGVWGAAKEKEEIREGTKFYIPTVVFRALKRIGEIDDEADDEAGGEGAEEAEEPEIQWQVTLSRKSKDANPQWGFLWSDVMKAEEKLVIAGIKEDSPLEKWNLKKRAMQDIEAVVHVGDRVVDVNDTTDFAEMGQQMLNSNSLTLTFGRRQGSQPSNGGKKPDLGEAVAESDGETQRRQQAALDQIQRRVDFNAAASSCFDALPESLQQLFAAEKEGGDNLEKLPLERCLQHFNGVEAIEDDFKPVYTCAKCSKEEKGRRSFASRRMWLCANGLPDLLTLQLKRFRRLGDRFDKSIAKIRLPLTLDLSDYILTSEQLASLEPYVEKGLEEAKSRCASSSSSAGDKSKMQYELYALCCHEGKTMKSGHYIAYVNAGPDLEREDWYHISDTKMRKCSRTEVLGAQGYVVFYRRPGTGPTTDGEASPVPPESTNPKEEKKEDEDDGDDGAADDEGAGDAEE